MGNGSGLGLSIVGAVPRLGSPSHLSLYGVGDPTVVDDFLLTFETPGHARAVAVYNGLAYVADHLNGLQVINYQTGFLVSTPEGAAHRIRFLLDHRRRLDRIGEIAREFVRENFLLTRHLRDYLTLVFALTHAESDRILYI